MFYSLLKFSALILACSSLASAAPAKRQACAQVHVIVARASTEPVGEGLTAGVVDMVIRQSRQSITREAVDYPAQLLPYGSSSSTGTQAVISQLTAFVNRCPTTKVVLMGYSQGAHIIGDAMCGGGGVLFSPTNAAVPSSVSNRVVAVMQMGDPRHTAGESYKRGTSTRSGLFPRPVTQSCERFANKFRSYCDADDVFCDSGTNMDAHMVYVDVYGADAAAWVVSMIGG